MIDLDYKCANCVHYDKNILQEPCVRCFGKFDLYEENHFNDSVKAGDAVIILETAIWEDRVKPGDIFVIDEVDNSLPNWVLVRHKEGLEKSKRYRRLNIGGSTKFAILR